MCPSLSSTLYTITINPKFQMLILSFFSFLCPFSYTFQTTLPPHVPSSCSNCILPSHCHYLNISSIFSLCYPVSNFLSFPATTMSSFPIPQQPVPTCGVLNAATEWGWARGCAGRDPHQHRSGSSWGCTPSHTLNLLNIQPLLPCSCWARGGSNSNRSSNSSIVICCSSSNSSGGGSRNSCWKQ